MGGKPSIPEYVPPAAKPERQVDVQVEDVQLGDPQSQDTSSQRKGKRSLMRPSGAGTGLAV